ENEKQMKHITIYNSNSKKRYLKKFKSNLPFEHIVIEKFLKKDSAIKILKNFKINKNWINYSFVNNYRKYALRNKKYMNKTLKELISELGSKKFINLLSEITGMENIFLDPTLDGGGLHQIFNGGSLNIHTDYNSHYKEKKWKRVLNLLIYLNKDWKKKYKGELELWNSIGTRKVKSYVPSFNRCIIFKTGKKSYHGHPVKLKIPKNFSRKSIAVYYFVKQEKDLKLSPTKYISRPSDKFSDQILIKIDMFLNNFLSFFKRYNLFNDELASRVLSLINKNK
ncbi:2OG-Fe(II) oxygenase, partial [Candidatus Pelagibacter sp.]|nr:2OG-Fe(II) oxygenase [Candidatus Pelagibacter sp.]